MNTTGVFQRRSWFALLVAASLVTPAWSWAAGAPGAPDEAAAAEAGALEEVTVTARKTAESLQTTPVAVTALSEASLAVNQEVEVKSLQGSVPNLAIGGSGTGPTSLVYMAIRGEGQNSPNSASDAAVGIYVDGVYFGRPLVGNLGLLDVSRVEVLRGPQGTLFGRNTTGGAVSITTNQPTGRFEGNAQVDYGKFNDALGSLVLNLPISGDELATRFAFRFHRHDAYYNSYVPGGTDPDKLKYDYAGRASVRWAPSYIPLTMALTADLVGEGDTGTPANLMGVSPDPAGAPAAYQAFTCIPGVSPFAALGCQNASRYVLGTNGVQFGQYYGGLVAGKNGVVGNCILAFCGYNGPTLPYNAGGPFFNAAFNDNKAFGFALNTDADLGPTHLKSITAFRQSTTRDASDLDGTPVDIAAFYSAYRQHQISEELQLSGKIDKFDVIGGLYFFHESGTERSDSNILPIFSAAFYGKVTPYGVKQDYADFSATSKAAFIQTNYHITDTLRATVGYRYTKDGRDLVRHGRADIYGANFCLVAPTTGPCNDRHSVSFTYPAWTVGFDWQATDATFLYLKASKADMAGGFNTRYVPPPVSSSFRPETNQDYEVGIKSELFNRQLRVNLAAFFAKQGQVQRIVNTVQNGQLTQYVTNAGNSHSYGPELEVTALPLTGLEVTLTAAYLHTNYVAGTFTEQQNVGSAAAPVYVTVDRSGEPIPQAPKYTVGVGATQTVPVGIGDLAFHLDYAYRASLVYTWETPAPQLPAATQAIWNTANRLGTIPGYGVLNGRIAFTPANYPDLEIALQGRNLTDKHYFQQQFDSYTGLGTSINYLADPRTYGLSVRYKF
jgi:iron complex outermembrane receptor protein